MAKFLDLLNAAKRDDIFSVMGLMWQGLDINCRDSMNRTVLHHLMLIHATGWFKWATVLKLFVALGADINAVDMLGMTPLHYVILNNDKTEDLQILKVKHLFELGTNINVEFEYGLTSLHRAIQQQNLPAIEVLLSLGVDVNACKYFNCSALQTAVEKERAKLAECLVELGADLNSSRNDVAPIFQAVESGRLDILKVLIVNGADVNVRRGHNMTPVITATDDFGNQEMAQWLAATGADLNAVWTMSSVLHEVIRFGRVDMLECLVSAGLDLSLHCFDGVKAKTVLTMAIDKNDLAFAEILLNNGADVNLKHPHANNSFFTAMRQGNDKMVKALVRIGVDINLVTIDTGTTIFSKAVAIAAPDMVKLLIEHGADINSTFERLTPIHEAVARGDIGMLRVLAELGAHINAERLERMGLIDFLIFFEGLQDGLTKLKMLVEAGIDINVCYSECVTALHDAVRLGKTEMIQTLCELGADINPGKIEGKTSLVTAISEEREDIVRYLIKKGADPNVQYRTWVSPLHDAVRIGNINIAYSLINAGASNEYGKVTMFPLQLAIHSRDHKMVRCLLDCGANFNERTIDITAQHDAVSLSNTDMIRLTNCPGGTHAREGMTPLWESVSQDLYDITETLLIAGADVNGTPSGASPLDWAVKQGNSDCIILLRSLGQKCLTLEQETALYMACWRGFIDLARLLIITGSDANKPDNLGMKPLEYLPIYDIVDYHVLQEASTSEKVVEEIHIEAVSVDKCQEMTAICHTPGIGNVALLPKPSSREMHEKFTRLLETPTNYSKELHGRVKGIGSAAEGTKVGLPNEMDFLFERKIEPSEERKIVDSGQGYVQYGFEADIMYFIPISRKGSFYFHLKNSSLIFKHIAMAQTLNPGSKHFVFSLDAKSVRATNRKACSVYQMEWNDGSTHYVISVDIVPSLHVDNWPKGATTKTWLMDEDELRSRGYYIVPKPPHVDSELANFFTQDELQSAWKISFPHLETEHMQRLEQRVKDVYLTAKCLRNPDVCRILILEEGKLPRPVDKYITSYQLKMCFFQNVEHFLETDLSLEEMVCKVYNDLEEGLTKGFIPLFFLPKVSALAGIKVDISKCLKVAKIMARFVRGLYLRDRSRDSCEFSTDEDQEVVVYQRKPGAVYNTYRI